MPACWTVLRPLEWAYSTLQPTPTDLKKNTHTHKQKQKSFSFDFLIQGLCILIYTSHSDRLDAVLDAQVPERKVRTLARMIFCYTLLSCNQFPCCMWLQLAFALLCLCHGGFSAFPLCSFSSCIIFLCDDSVFPFHRVPFCSFHIHDRNIRSKLDER